MKNEEEVFENAKFVADDFNLMYGTQLKWEEWGVSARDDFWSIAQDMLDTPKDKRISLPDKYAVKL
jgi:hypothetical protein